jgi:hypothetical protein
MRRFVTGYTRIALLFLSTVVALLATEATLFVTFAVHDRVRQESNPVSTMYGNDRLKRVYPDLSEEQMIAMLDETWRRSVVFEPFTQFKEREVQGEYVNVHAAGFRGNGGAALPWPPVASSVNVFVFGGSTTFGYGLPDGQTVAAQLHATLTRAGGPALAIYNFGRGFYFSSQERVLFEQLLVEGREPDIAIFIDGLNDFAYSDGVPEFSVQLINAYAQVSVPAQVVRLLQASSIGRLADGIRWRLEERTDLTLPVPNSAITARTVTRYLDNKRMIEAVADAYRVKTVFVWQPIPGYNYDDSHHPFKGETYGRHSNSPGGYRELAARLGEMRRRDNFLWLADAQVGRKEPLYVDQVHYTGAFVKTIAAALGEHMIARRLVVKSPDDEAAATDVTHQLMRAD